MTASSRSLSLLLVSWLTLIAASAAPLAVTPMDKTSPAAVPPLPERWHAEWRARVAKLAENARAGADIVFVGDSITQAWEGPGKAAWTKHFAPHGKCLNLGISGDRTEQVLWRMDQAGHLPPELRAKVFVVLIGTNNAGARKDTSADIAAGVEAILGRIRRGAPNAKIVLTAIFPRTGSPAEAPALVAGANPLLKALAEKSGAIWFDINDVLAPGGKVSRDVFPDGLHLSPKGYELWASRLEPVLVGALR